MSREGMEACGDRGILERCQELHMMHTGAMEENETAIAEHTAVLNAVLRHWYEPGTRHRDYDAAVKQLVMVVLTEKPAIVV